MLGGGLRRSWAVVAKGGVQGRDLDAGKPTTTSGKQRNCEKVLRRGEDRHAPQQRANGGVLVDKTRSHVIEELKTLEDAGVEIVCCGACIDYHKIDLAVGNPTNMYFIVEDMRKANKVIQP